MRISIRPGTRDWLKEVGNIVLGVLLALILGEGMSRLNWRWTVDNAQPTLTRESSDVFAQARLRVQIERCVARRIDLVEQVLNETAVSRQLRPIYDLGAPPFATWDSGVWQSLVAANTVGHLPTSRQRGYAVAYEFVSALDDANRRESAVWARLDALRGRGRPIGETEQALLRQSLAEARGLNALMAVSSVGLLRTAVRYELPYDRAIVFPAPAPAPSSSYPPRVRAICRNDRLPPEDARPQRTAAEKALDTGLTITNEF